MDPEDIQVLNEYREIFVREAEILAQGFSSGKRKVCEYCYSLYQFIASCEIQKKLKKQELFFKEKGKKLMWSMIWPILIVVGANTFYHICAKSTPENANAFASLAITYGVGAVLSIVMFYLTGARGLAGELGKTNWTAWVLGIAVVGLEFGNICLYRAGWKVSVGSLIANITLACVLLAVGLLLYHETITLRQGLGVLVCLAGIYLVGA